MAPHKEEVVFKKLLGVLILALLIILAVQLIILTVQRECRQSVTTIETAPVIPPEWSVEHDADPGVPAYQLID